MLKYHCLVDYGLAKPYIDFETKKHISYSENRSITGKVLIVGITYKHYKKAKLLACIASSLRIIVLVKNALRLKLQNICLSVICMYVQ